MRALIWIMLVATGLWSGYWWVGATGLEKGVNKWIAQQQGSVTAEKVEVHGIPNRFDLTVTAPVFSYLQSEIGAAEGVVSPGGIEPPTNRLRVCCSAS